MAPWRRIRPRGSCLEPQSPRRAVRRRSSSSWARGHPVAMAAAGRLKLKRLGAKPGSLGSYAGNTLGIPTITLELPRKASRLSKDELWNRYGSMLLVATSRQQAK